MNIIAKYNNMLTNPKIKGLFFLFVVLFASKTVPDLPPLLNKLANSIVSRILVIYTIMYMSTVDVKFSIIVALVLSLVLSAYQMIFEGFSMPQWFGSDTQFVGMVDPNMTNSHIKYCSNGSCDLTQFPEDCEDDDSCLKKEQKEHFDIGDNRFNVKEVPEYIHKNQMLEDFVKVPNLDGTYNAPVTYNSKLIDDKLFKTRLNNTCYS